MEVSTGTTQPQPSARTGPWWSRLRHAVWDFVYPPHCPLCGRAVAADAARFGTFQPLCELCLDDVLPPTQDCCLRCGAPVGPHLDTADGCVHCRDDRFAFTSACALGTYTGRLRSACLLGKESHGDAAVAALTVLLARTHAEWFAARRPEVVVPVPAHWRDGLRHDVPRTMAGVLARELRRPVVAGVSKRRRPPRQATLKPTQRRRNLRDAFAEQASRRVRNRMVLLVDDVLTTGTTAHECAKVLRESGAADVHVAVLARGLGTR